MIRIVENGQRVKIILFGKIKFSMKYDLFSYVKKAFTFMLVKADAVSWFTKEKYTLLSLDYYTHELYYKGECKHRIKQQGKTVVIQTGTHSPGVGQIRTANQRLHFQHHRSGAFHRTYNGSTGILGRSAFQ